MRIKRVLTFISIIPLLVGCNKDKYAGEYVFQLGKDKGTHMAVSLNLTTDLYDENDVDKGKKYELTMDMSTSGGQEDLMEMVKALTPVTGFYKVDNNEKVYGEPRLNLGLALLGEFEIPQNLTDLLFVAGIKGGVVTFYLPVSFIDLTFQLYWYGYDINIQKAYEEGDADPLDTPEGKHPVGTHPTQEDIDQINTHYAADHDGTTFRDYHILKLGLTKQ